MTPLDPAQLRSFRDWFIDQLEKQGAVVGDRGLTMPPDLSADLVMEIHMPGEVTPRRIELTLKELPG
jgi:hypothetical protein